MADSDLKRVPALLNGVRTPVTMATRRSDPVSDIRLT